MGADDLRPAFGRDHMRGDRPTESLMRFGRRDRSNEELARGADQKRQSEGAKFVQARQHDHALLVRLAKADAGVEHDIFAANTRARGDVERARKEGGDILHDVDGGIGAIANGALPEPRVPGGDVKVELLAAEVLYGRRIVADSVTDGCVPAVDHGDPRAAVAQRDRHVDVVVGPLDRSAAALDAQPDVVAEAHLLGKVLGP